MITKIPPTAKVELASTCNLRCTYCYKVGRLGADDQQTQGPTDLEGFEALMYRLADVGFYQVAFTGGETTLNKPMLFRGLEIAGQLCWGTTLNTNLTLLTLDDARHMKDLGLQNVLGSFPDYGLENWSAITGSPRYYPKALEAIAALRDADLTTAINMVLIQANKDHLYETGRQLVEQFGIVNFAGTPLYPAHEGQVDQMLTRDQVVEVMDQLLALKDEFGINVSILRPMNPCIVDDQVRYADFFKHCSAAVEELTVDLAGNLRVCSSHPEPFGNIMTESLDTILARMAAWRTEPGENGTLIPEACNPCAIVDRCRGGCRIEALTINGALDQPNPYMREPLTDSDIPCYRPRTPNLLLAQIEMKPIETQVPVGENFDVTVNGTTQTMNPAEVALFNMLCELDGKTPWELTRELHADRDLVQQFLTRMHELNMLTVKSDVRTLGVY